MSIAVSSGQSAFDLPGIHTYRATVWRYLCAGRGGAGEATLPYMLNPVLPIRIAF
jgi:hypothetical protein